MRRKQVIATDIVQAPNAGLELGAYAKQILGISNRRLQKAVRTKGLVVNGRPAHSKRKLRTGDQVEVMLPAEEQIKISVANYSSLKILFEDQWLLAVDKPAGLPTYAVQGTRGLANQVAGYFLAQNLKLTPRPVHRLDTPTSGVVLFAKDAITQTLMGELWANGKVRRLYFALCQGQLTTAQEINTPLKGQRAITRLTPIKVHPNCTELEVELITGRTHQIRQHLQLLGHPLLGDRRYGSGKKKGPRLALHATSVSFIHPQQQEQKVEVHSPVPLAEFRDFLVTN